MSEFVFSPPSFPLSHVANSHSSGSNLSTNCSLNVSTRHYCTQNDKQGFNLPVLISDFNLLLDCTKSVCVWPAPPLAMSPLKNTTYCSLISFRWAMKRAAAAISMASRPRLPRRPIPVPQLLQPWVVLPPMACTHLEPLDSLQMEPTPRCQLQAAAQPPCSPPPLVSLTTPCFTLKSHVTTTED